MKNFLKRNAILCRVTVVLMLVLTLTACGAQPLPEQFDEETVKAEAEKALSLIHI